MFNKRGFTLIEMVIAIVIIGVGVTGLLVAFSSNVRSSADPLISKQLVAAAEEVMEETLLKPYVAAPAATGGLFNCGTPGAVRNAFDDVLDYNGYQTDGICDIDGTAVAGLSSGSGYSMQITATNIGTWQGVPNTLMVTVTVSKDNASFTLTNWRTDPS